jgi:signal transduction histidine kinase
MAQCIFPQEIAILVILSVIAMKRLISVLIVLALIQSAGYGQDRTIDSLTRELNKAGNDRRKQADLNAELAIHVLNYDVEKATAYGRKAIDIAKKGKYDKELAKAYVNTGYAYSAGGSFDESFALADSAWRLAEKENYFEVKFSSQSLMGGNKRRMALYDEALPYYLKATKIAEAEQAKGYMGKAYNNLGVFYVTINDLERAEEYHKKSLAMKLELGNPREIFYSYDNLGILNREKKNYEKALQYYFKAEEYAYKCGDSSIISFIYNDIGAAYSFSGSYENAEKYLKASIGLRERMNEMDELAYTYNYLGENYERKKDIVNAERNIKSALAIAKEIANNKQTYEAFESLSDFYARNKKYDSAYQYAMHYKHFKDSITRKNQGEVIAELNTKYETEKKERRIQEQQFEISKRNYWLAGVSGLLIMGTSLGYSRHKRNKLRQRAAVQAAVLRQQELATKAIIQAEENERKRIATDLHDGVGQMMSAAKMNLSSLKGELLFGNSETEKAFDNAISLVDDSCKEVRNTSHNIMPNALLKTGLTNAIREFVHKIDQRVMQVNLYSEGLNERMAADMETVLYRVVQECVNNVIKHSGANKLDITLIKDEEGISVTVEDNGKGFNMTGTRKLEGLGLKNIRTRIDYLKGEVEWSSAEGKGTAVTINIPTKDSDT